MKVYAGNTYKSKFIMPRGCHRHTWEHHPFLLAKCSHRSQDWNRQWDNTEVSLCHKTVADTAQCHTECTRNWIQI